MVTRWDRHLTDGSWVLDFLRSSCLPHPTPALLSPTAVVTGDARLDFIPHVTQLMALTLQGGRDVTAELRTNRVGQKPVERDDDWWLDTNWLSLWDCSLSSLLWF